MACLQQNVNTEFSDTGSQQAPELYYYYYAQSESLFSCNVFTLFLGEALDPVEATFAFFGLEPASDEAPLLRVRLNRLSSSISSTLSSPSSFLFFPFFDKFLPTPGSLFSMSLVSSSETTFLPLLDGFFLF